MASNVRLDNLINNAFLFFCIVIERMKLITFQIEGIRIEGLGIYMKVYQRDEEGRIHILTRHLDTQQLTIDSAARPGRIR